MAVNPTIFNTAFNTCLDLPHCRWLKIYGECTSDEPVISVDWRDELLENKESGNIHGGVITTLVDMASACTLAAQFERFESIATLDMRIDYLKQPVSGQAIHARAHCYKTEGQIAYIRSHCYQEDETQPFALGMATFVHRLISLSELQVTVKQLKKERSELKRATINYDAELKRRAYELMPYSKAINLKIGTDSENRRIYCLPFSQDHIGDFIQMALHGGLIGGFLQSCINLHVMEELNLSSPARIIDYSTDYLLSGRPEDSYARCEIIHAGKRISQVTATMWQSRIEKPIAFARAQIQMPVVE